MRRSSVLVFVVGTLLGACSSGQPDVPPLDGSPDTPLPTPDTGAPQAEPTTPPAASADVHIPARFTGETAYAVVEHLAGEIGPREATSSAFAEAAEWVTEQFEDLGYNVTNVEVDVPRGDPDYRPEWGTVIEAGTSANVVADPPGLDPAQPHVVIGAHLDTVAVSPGAEDNASGVGVMLELAALAAAQPDPPPVRFIAFGAEEPRGPGDDMHHFGSQQYVAGLAGEERDAIDAMVALDRVGVSADSVPICTGGSGTTSVRDALIDAAATVEIDAQRCENRASDHWSFEKAGIPAARLGSIPYGGYHSPGDVPDVVDIGQLERVGLIVWAWIRALDGQ
jgi:hypothetical protein